MRMKLRGSRGAFGISSAQHDHERDPARADRIDDSVIAAADTLLADRELPVAVTAGDVYAGQVERDVSARRSEARRSRRPWPFQYLRQMPIERVEIRGILRSVHQCDVHR